MGIQSFTPSGGGGTPGFDYIASVNMTTYNRTWAQSGAAGKYVLDSYNKNSGYAYFVGSVTTGIPLGYVADVTHSFTSINIVAPQNDYISLFKAAVKTTTVFNNALDGFASFPSTISSSGNFVLPNNALPLVNVMIIGGGGGGSPHCGGGAGGGIVKLTAYQAVGTTAVTVGAANRGETNGSGGGTSYFGNVYALGGANGSTNHTQNPINTFANGGGIGHVGGFTNSALTGGLGFTQTSSTGLGIKGSPTYIGGFKGGDMAGGLVIQHGGTGGGGSGGNGGGRTSISGTTSNGGAGHISDFTGTSYYYGAGGRGAHHSAPNADSSQYSHGVNDGGFGQGRGGTSGGSPSPESQSGGVLVRYYIP